MTVKTYEQNRLIVDDVKAFVEASDTKYNEKIKALAKTLMENREKTPVVLLSGPSGSGKTTTALTLEKYMDDVGCETHTLSLDNYFFPITERDKELNMQGKFDLESPARVDTDFLNEQLTDIIDCKPVALPKFDFRTESRIFTGEMLHRKPGEMVILEGVHSLNPDVITLPDEACAKIYVSVRTRVDNGSIVLHPSNIRLLRRMIRDGIYRARTPEHTLKMFDSVEQGAVKYIMPYKYRAEYQVDTFIDYEINVYKMFLERELQKLSGYKNIDDILSVFDSIEGIDEKEISEASLIREFIGNGRFKY